MEMAKFLMNPVRQRIFQYLLTHGTGTVKEIRRAIPDVSGASLYRHIKQMTERSILQVVGENRIRGTVESVYRLNQDALELNDPEGAAVQLVLLSISAAFANYFSEGQADPKKDLYLLDTCTLKLTDEAFLRFLSEIRQLALRYMDEPVCEAAKTRQITLISAPPAEQEKPGGQKIAEHH